MVPRLQHEASVEMGTRAHVKIAGIHTHSLAQHGIATERSGMGSVQTTGRGRPAVKIAHNLVKTSTTTRVWIQL